MSFITNRLSRAAEIPASIGDSCQSLGETVSGIVGTALSVLTLGKVDQFNQCASKIDNSNEMIRPLYKTALQVVNPNAFPFDADVWHEKSVLTEKLANPIFEFAQETSTDSGFFQRHVVSRGAYALGAVVSCITRLADMVLGALATVLSFVTLGMVPKINEFAHKQLGFTGVIADISLGIRGLVNPQQFKRDECNYNEYDGSDQYPTDQQENFSEPKPVDSDSE